MNKTLLATLLVISAPVVTLHAADDNTAENSSHKGLYVELGGRENPDAVWGAFGIYSEVSENLLLKGGLSFLASESSDNIFTGANIGYQYSFDTKFSPFIGVSIFAGYSKEDVLADNDNRDNDDDGFIDERGEEKSRVDDMIASVYPEIGFHYWLRDSTKLSFSGKYHITTEGRAHDFWLFGAGLSFSF